MFDELNKTWWSSTDVDEIEDDLLKQKIIDKLSLSSEIGIFIVIESSLDLIDGGKSIISENCNQRWKLKDGSYLLVQKLLCCLTSFDPVDRTDINLFCMNAIDFDDSFTTLVWADEQKSIIIRNCNVT